MPFPDRLAKINRRLTNPLVRRFAGWVPPLAIVIHQGRSSGRMFRTPVMAFPAHPGIMIALTYGADRDWVKNLQAANGGTLIQRGRQFDFVHPIIVDETIGYPLMPAPARLVLRRAGVRQFLRASRLDGEDR